MIDIGLFFVLDHYRSLLLSWLLRDSILHFLSRLFVLHHCIFQLIFLIWWLGIAIHLVLDLLSMLSLFILLGYNISQPLELRNLSHAPVVVVVTEANLGFLALTRENGLNSRKGRSLEWSLLFESLVGVVSQAGVFFIRTFASIRGIRLVLLYLNIFVFIQNRTGLTGLLRNFGYHRLVRLKNSYLWVLILRLDRNLGHVEKLLRILLAGLIGLSSHTLRNASVHEFYSVPLQEAHGVH